MSADLLREAAELMRTRATFATVGPWWLNGGEPWAGDEALTRRMDADDSLTDDEYATWERTTNSLFAGDVWHAPDAEHIASWHPAVALAVALLLDNEANSIDMADVQRGNGDYEWPAYNNGRRELLVDIATAYLGHGPCQHEWKRGRIGRECVGCGTVEFRKVDDVAVPGVTL